MKILTLCLLLLCSGSVMAEKEQKTYLCIEEVAGGLEYDTNTKSWQGRSFTVDQKYIVKTNDKNRPELAATVTYFGDNVPFFICPLGRKDIYGALICQNVISSFRFNQEKLRFLATYLSGYLDGKDNTKNTPAVVGGTCSPL